MFPCELKEQTSRPILSIRFHAPVQELPQHFARVYGAIMTYLEELGEHHTDPAFAAYYNMDMQNLEIEAGFPVSRPLPGKGEIKASTIPGGTFAICHYTGPYDQVGPAYEQLTQFVKEKGYMAANGMCYEWYLNGPEVPPKDLKTDVACAVTLVSEKSGA